MGSSFCGKSNLGLIEMKALLVFLLAVVIGTPITTAFNCTNLTGENQNFCDYIEKQNWPNSEKNALIEEAINSGAATLSGNFKSTMGNQIPCPFVLNKYQKKSIISENNKTLLITISKISLLGLLIYIPLRKYYLQTHS